MAIIKIQLGRFIGTTETLILWLHLNGGVLNPGGDVLTEIGHGEFQADVAETRAAANYGVYVTNIAEQIIWGDGVLYFGATTVDQIPAVSVNITGGDAREAKQDQILAKLTRPVKIHTNPPRPDHIDLIRGDAYDGSGVGTSHPKLSWDFGKDITGKPFTFTIRRKNDTTDIEPLLAINGIGAGQLAQPVLTSTDTNGLPVSTCAKDLKFDVEVRNADNSYQSQLGTCTVLEDQTRR